VKRQIDIEASPTKGLPDPGSESHSVVTVREFSSLKSNADQQVGLSKHSAQIPIRATLVGSEYCEALGLTGHGCTPVLALCRALVAAGCDPNRPLHAYRGDVLALKVRSIRDGARLRVATHGVGFESVSGCTGGSPVRQNGFDGSSQSAPIHSLPQQTSRRTRGRRR
jgi:hypothetical protein